MEPPAQLFFMANWPLLGWGVVGGAVSVLAIVVVWYLIHHLAEHASIGVNGGDGEGEEGWSGRVKLFSLWNSRNRAGAQFMDLVKLSMESMGVSWMYFLNDIDDFMTRKVS